jgi:hypothetical protein
VRARKVPRIFELAHWTDLTAFCQLTKSCRNLPIRGVPDRLESMTQLRGLAPAVGFTSDAATSLDETVAEHLGEHTCIPNSNSNA